MENYISAKKSKIRIGPIYVAIILSIIPLFNYNIAGRGLFLYLGIGLFLVFIVSSHKFTINRLYRNFI